MPIGLHRGRVRRRRKSASRSACRRSPRRPALDDEIHLRRILPVGHGAFAGLEHVERDFDAGRQAVRQLVARMHDDRAAAAVVRAQADSARRSISASISSLVMTTGAQRSRSFGSLPSDRGNNRYACDGPSLQRTYQARLSGLGMRDGAAAAAGAHAARISMPSDKIGQAHAHGLEQGQCRRLRGPLRLCRRPARTAGRTLDQSPPPKRLRNSALRDFTGFHHVDGDQLDARSKTS